MINIRKTITFSILIFFILAIIPFPILAGNTKVCSDIFTRKTWTEIYIPDAPETQGSVVKKRLSTFLPWESNVTVTHPEKYSQKITPGVNYILQYSGIKLEIPRGAVDKDVSIEIIKLESAPGVNATIKNVTNGAVSYRFQPQGIQFNKNIKISIPFNKSLLESETALSNLFTYFYDEDRNTWERLPRVGIDKENCTVVSLTNHFTDMINGILKMPESPGPVNFDLNSIKNLEAANPSSGVMKLQGLTAGSTGAASFQIPLNLPPGRGSAFPHLALSYNSESPNSWMGRGFDISVPSITTDTLFGLPEYDDTDTYIFGGEELVLIAGDSGYPKRYSPRMEKEFKRIIRKLEGGVDYWEVTDKNGRVQTFGTEQGWIGPNRNNHAKAYTWYLTKETDANGNFVSYIYDYDIDNKYTYLKEILYSGNNNVSTSDSGPYKVVFNTDIDTIPQNSPRLDRKIDARGAFISKLVRRLDEVQISYNGEVFRSYAFGYEQNEFGQTVLNSFAELDCMENEFYEYGFSYKTLSHHNAGAGIIAYDGFGTETIKRVQRFFVYYQ
jgi:Salmonella virulence plasmid 65kDa B protein